MKTTIIIIIAILLFFYIRGKILHPIHSKKLLEKSSETRHNLEKFIETIIGNKPTQENYQELALMLFENVLSISIWNYHRKKNFGALEVLKNLEKNHFKQETIINELKVYIQEHLVVTTLTSSNIKYVLEDARIKCNQLVNPSASLYGS